MLIPTWLEGSHHYNTIIIISELLPTEAGWGTNKARDHPEAPPNDHLHTCFAVGVVVMGTRGQSGGLAAAGEGRAGGRCRHGGWPRLAAASSVLGVLWRVHYLLETVWTFVEDCQELCREGLQQLQGDGLVHVPEPVPALCHPLDLGEDWVKLS